MLGRFWRVGQIICPFSLLVVVRFRHNAISAKEERTRMFWEDLQSLFGQSTRGSLSVYRFGPQYDVGSSHGLTILTQTDLARISDTCIRSRFWGMRKRSRIKPRWETVSYAAMVEITTLKGRPRLLGDPHGILVSLGMELENIPRNQPRHVFHNHNGLVLPL